MVNFICIIGDQFITNFPNITIFVVNTLVWIFFYAYKIYSI